MSLKTEQKKSELLNFDNITFTPGQLMADRDIERETMIGLDTLNDVVKRNWESKTKDEKLSKKNKEINQLEWVKLMNNYKNTAEEIISKN